MFFGVLLLLFHTFCNELLIDTSKKRLNIYTLSVIDVVFIAQIVYHVHIIIYPSCYNGNTSLAVALISMYSLRDFFNS